MSNVMFVVCVIITLSCNTVSRTDSTTRDDSDLNFQTINGYFYVLDGRNDKYFKPVFQVMISYSKKKLKEQGDQVDGKLSTRKLVGPDFFESDDYKTTDEVDVELTFKKGSVSLYSYYIEEGRKVPRSDRDDKDAWQIKINTSKDTRLNSENHHATYNGREGFFSRDRLKVVRYSFLVRYIDDADENIKRKVSDLYIAISPDGLVSRAFYTPTISDERFKDQLNFKLWYVEANEGEANILDFGGDRRMVNLAPKHPNYIFDADKINIQKSIDRSQKNNKVLDIKLLTEPEVM